MAVMPVTRVVLYKHGVGYFEREGTVEGDQSVVADVQAGRGQRRAQVADRPRPRRRPRRVGVVRLDQAARATARRGRPVDPRRGQPGRAACRRSRGRGSGSPRPAKTVEGMILGIDTTREADRRRRRRGRAPLAADRRRRGPLVRPARALRAHDPRRGRPPRPRFLPEDAALGQEEGRPDLHLLRPGRGRAQAPAELHPRGPGLEGDLPADPGRGGRAADDPGLGRRRQHAGRGLGERHALARRRPAGVVRPRPVHAALHPPAGRRGQGDDRRAAAGGRGGDGLRCDDARGRTRRRRQTSSAHEVAWPAHGRDGGHAARRWRRVAPPSARPPPRSASASSATCSSTRSSIRSRSAATSPPWCRSCSARSRAGRCCSTTSRRGPRTRCAASSSRTRPA